MSCSELTKLVAIIGIDKMEKIVQQYKQSQQPVKPKTQKKPKVIDEYDEFLHQVDRLQDFAFIRWQLGVPTWAVVGNDILPQQTVGKKKPGVQ